MANDDTPTLPIRALGPYRLLRHLGTGGMAEVYLARASGASGFQKLVALKVLRHDLADEATLARSLIDEACLGARLTHRNLVSIHDLGVAEGRYYVRLDYVDGADLHHLIRQDRPSIALALLIIEEIAAALTYIHGATDVSGRDLGLVHRDVTPTNILLSRHGDVKLTDLGIAKATALADITRANVRKGKYAYMSPEQVDGAPLDAKSDQFALGVTLAELLTGRRLFEGETPLQTMDLIRKAAPPDLHDLDGDLRELILRTLQRDPKARFPDTESLREALRDLRRARDPVDLHDLGRWVRNTLKE